MAQLELSVVLNLANFRTQLGKLAQASAAYYYPINLTIDKQAFKKQLTALGNIKPVIKIDDSQLDAARARISTLNKSLATLRRATSAAIEIKVKYKEEGRPAAGTGAVGRAITGRAGGEEALANKSRGELQKLYGLFREANLRVGELSKSLAKSSAEEIRQSLVPAFSDSGEEAVNGLAVGLKDPSSKVSKAAERLAKETIQDTKKAFGIASPSRVFKEIGKDLVAGLEIGFEDFNELKTKMVGKMRELVAVMRMEAAKVSDVSGMGGPSMGSLRRQLLGQRAYTSPIGPQPLGSKTPWAAGSAGQFGSSGYEPRMVSRPYTGAPNFLSAGPLMPGGAPAASQGAYGARPFFNTAMGAVGGYNPGVRSSAFFPMSGMMGPSSPLGTITPQSSMFGAGGPPSPPPRLPTGGSGGSFGGIQFNVPQLPGAGLVREIGTEFGFAAKQVLLFGTAYKALAFIQGFPAQVGSAVGALQSFRNTLSAISPSAEEAAASSQFILDVVDKYNTPIQSARDGFTKLYASMKPTGFSGNEIRDLFLGISQAAATFGMSAEKVDRVNYAFAQMASKGQVMSEELKGQLGDVLPGAMGIFAEAAGFTGPNAITKFSKALEDGAYKGAAMKTLLTNVGIVMRKEFGPGAEGAARTFQGVINRMQNSFTLLYESFEPVAVGFLNSVVMPLTSGIKTVTDGFNAFFTGTQAKTTGGMVFAQELERLKPTFDGIRANVAALMPVLQGFGQTLLEVGKIALQITGNPLVGYLGRLYLIVLPINMALGILRGLWASNALQLVIFNARVATGTSTLTAFRGMTAATGATATVAAGQVRGFGLALRAALATTVVGLAVVGLGMIAEAFMTAGAKAEAARQKMSQFMDSVKQLGKIGDVVGATTAAATEKASAIRIKQAETLLTQIKAGKKTVSEAQMKELRALGLASNMQFVQEKGQKGLTVQGMFGAIDANIKAAQQGYLETQTRIVQATQAVTEAKKNQAKEEANLENVDLSADDGKKASLESYASLQDQLAKDFTQAQIDRLEQEYQARVDRINDEFDLREARANSFQKEAIKFERQMAGIELKKQKALLDASNEVLKARGSVAGGAGGMGGMTTGATGLLQGNTGISGGAHFHISRADGSPLSADQARALLDPSVRRQVTKTSDYGPRQAPVPGASTFHRGVDLAGPANTPLNLAPGYSMVGQGEEGGLGYAATVQGPQGEMYKVGHLQRPGVGAGAGAGAPRKVPGSEKRDIVADQKAQLAVAQESLLVQIAEAQAVRDAAIAWAEYTTAITPIEEQKLQNSLLAKKNELVKSGLPDDVIEKEMKQFETQQKTAMAVDVVNKMLSDKKISAEKAASMIAELNKNMADYNKLLGDNLVLQNQQKFDANMGALRKQLDIAGIIDPRKELRASIAQQRTGYSAEQVEQEALLQEQVNAAQKTRDQLRGIASTIGDSFGEAFKGIITGSMTVREALAGMFQSIADSFADMVAQMIAEWLKAQVIQGFQSIFSAVLPGLGAAAGGLSSGFSAGTSSAIDTGAAGWASSFATPLKFANGGITAGGFQAFANGGIVTGPTLGLVGEGRYNEAVIPLPDGKSVPVELSGGGSSSPTVIVNVDAKGSQVEGNEQNANQLGRAISAAVQTELIKQQRPGGLLAR